VPAVVRYGELNRSRSTVCSLRAKAFIETDATANDDFIVDKKTVLRKAIRDGEKSVVPMTRSGHLVLIPRSLYY
jgi:hypothetical protein